MGSRGLEFRILGPLEVWRDGAPVRLGGERQRALLALLLLHANEPVSTEQLVEELFGGERSDAAVNAARVAVSRLRRLFENSADDAAGVLVTRQGGYVLQTGAEQVDAALFERLLGEGRQLLEAGDASSASVRLREALALWRGPPFADLTLLEFVQPEMRRLEEMRLVALMERIDADLALGGGGELVAELERLVASNPLQERLRGQLMLALYRAGRQADALAVYRQASDLLRDELGLEPSRALQELERRILQHDSGLDRGARAPAAAVALCPYKGLAAFDRSDAEYFCGRQRIVSEVAARIAEAPLVGIVGPSGIGKSSLLRAGVLPALTAGALPGSQGWRQVLIRPGAHPCAELEHALGGRGLEAVTARLQPGDRLVVAVDQLEEVFTACGNEDERVAFLAQLAAATRDIERRVLALVALRADFYGRCASYGRFAKLLSRSHVLVGPMERDELAEAIELPARRAGLDVERPLVDALVGDLAGEVGALPLLSTTLLELWRAREGRVLRHQSYRASGGVRGAVARLAEEAYTRLDHRSQHVARVLMLRLAGGEDGAFVRRRVPVAELLRIEGADPVLAALTDARLLTTMDGEVEVSHEALLREWPRYRSWLEEDRVGRRLHQHLATGAREWEARGRDPGDLYRGARLAGAIDWAVEHDDELIPLEREFLAAGRQLADAEARRQRTQNRRLRALLAGAEVFLAISVIAGIIALVKQNKASNEARAALAGKLGAEAVNQPRVDLAMLLAREAVNLDQGPDTAGTLLSTLLRAPAAIGTFSLPITARPQAAAVSPDGHTLAVSDNTAHIRFYDPRTRAVARPPIADIGEPFRPLYSSDGSLLIYPAIGNPPFIAVRNVRTLRPIAKLLYDRVWLSAPTLDNPNASLLISPDGRTVYFGYWVLDKAGRPGAAYLDRWSLPSGHSLPTIRIGSGPLALGLAQGAHQLDVIEPTGVTTFDASTLARLRTVPMRIAGSMQTGAVSPDGATAVVGSQRGSVYFVDLASGDIHQGVGGHSATVANVAYSPTARAVVTASDDGTLIVWDPRSARQLEMLRGHGGPAHGVAFSADGETLYTTSLDGVVLEWDLGTTRRFGRELPLGAPASQSGPISPPTLALASSADGLRFAAALGSSTWVSSPREH